jgi:hypothetical protein
LVAVRHEAKEAVRDAGVQWLQQVRLRMMVVGDEGEEDGADGIPGRDGTRPEDPTSQRQLASQVHCVGAVIPLPHPPIPFFCVLFPADISFAILRPSDLWSGKSAHINVWRSRSRRQFCVLF